MKKIIGILCICFILSACGNKSEKTVVCTNEMEAGNIKQELSAKGDSLFKRKQTATGSLSASNMSEEDAKSIFDQAAALYKGIKGITYSYEVKDNKFDETVIINLEKANEAELKKVNVVSGDTSKGYSLKRTVDAFESEGYTCK